MDAGLDVTGGCFHLDLLEIESQWRSRSRIGLEKREMTDGFYWREWQQLRKKEKQTDPGEDQSCSFSAE